MRSLIGALIGRGPVRNDAPVPYVGRRSTGLGSGQRAGGGGPLSRMRASGTLFAIVNRTSTRTAAVDWALYRKPATGKPAADTDREPVGIHAALSLWLQWNPFMTGTQGVEVGQQHIDLAGETFLVVVKVGGVPVELWPVRPDRMLEDPHPTKFLAGWIYRSPDGDKIPLGIDEVIQLKMPDPENFYRGLSPVSALLTDLDAGAAAARWNANFFENSAQPGGIIEVPDGLDDDQFDEMTERWNEQHRGVQNAHRVAIIEHGTWKDRSFSPKDLDFSALRNLNRDALLEGYGMSRTSLGITDGVNFAAAKAARWQVAEDITVPRVERWKAALNGQLLPMFGATGKAVEFDYESPVPADDEAENADRDSRVQAVATLVTAGWNPASAAEAYGLPEMQYGSGEQSDPDRDLMVQLVTAAPAALAPLLLPILLPNVEFPSTAPAEPEPDEDDQQLPPDGEDDEPAPDPDEDDADAAPAKGATQDDHDLAARGRTPVHAATSHADEPWPGSSRERAVADLHAQRLADALTAEIDGPTVAAAWLASGQAARARQLAEDGQDPGQPARDWVHDLVVSATVAAVLAVNDAAVDGYLVGTLAAEALLADTTDIDWQGWEPGDVDAARRILDDRGLLPKLNGLLAAARSRIEAARKAGGLGPGIKTDMAEWGKGFAHLLTNAATAPEPEPAEGEPGPAELLGQQLDDMAADPNFAYVTVQARSTGAAASAAIDSYRAADGVLTVRWLMDEDLQHCKVCPPNEAHGPVAIGSMFPSGDTRPPIHPRCGCFLAPVRVQATDDTKEGS